jgi:hypothetical protein
MPSEMELLRAFGSEKIADESANTRSNKGNIVTASPQISPFKLAIIVFGKAASVIRKLLK